MLGRRLVALAEREIRLAHEEALLPIIVGGTGMYLRTLMTGIAQMPPVDSDIRENVRSRMVRDGSIALHAELAKIDPKSAARINASDSQRIARAVEIYEATGKTLTEWQTGGAEAAGGTAYTLRPYCWSRHGSSYMHPAMHDLKGCWRAVLLRKSAR